MFRALRTSLAVLAVVAALSGGAFAVGTAHATTQQKAAQPQQKEHHQALQRSITQLEAIKDRLQRAPSDFGGHKAKAIDAINLAMDELHQAINFDKR